MTALKGLTEIIAFSLKMTLASTAPACHLERSAWEGKGGWMRASFHAELFETSVVRVD
jgi:hypothetical protein